MLFLFLSYAVWLEACWFSGSFQKTGLDFVDSLYWFIIFNFIDFWSNGVIKKKNE